MYEPVDNVYEIVDYGDDENLRENKDERASESGVFYDLGFGLIFDFK
jgi:hypothetical protein